MRLRFTFALVLATQLATSIVVREVAAAERQFPLPILMVSGEPQVGACVRPSFRLLRLPEDRTPLSLAVTEDTPGGAGESIRASMWLAAMVAALNRQDDLSGVRVTLELSGRVDGPSAGAGLCLAILSALDDREFPADCAATGAIMPDGTIGGVGGIAAKIRAASKAGIRRVFVPAYLRFERDSTSGEEIDLKRLAASLKLELIPVENVAQAYRILHGAAPMTMVPPERGVLDLPETTEEVFKRQYQIHHRAGTELWEAIPEADRQEIAAHPFTKGMFVDERVKAENAFRAGKLIYAANTVWGWHLALEARRGNIQALEGLKPEDFQKQDVAGVIRQMDSIFLKDVESLARFVASPPAPPPRWSEAAAQLYADRYEALSTVGINLALQQNVDEIVAELTKPDLKPEDRTTQFQSLVDLKIVQLLLARFAREAADAWQPETDAVVKTFPHRAVQDDAAAVERLFYSAQSAVHNTFQHDVVRRWAQELKTSEAHAQAVLLQNDLGLAMYFACAETAIRWHEELTTMEASPQRRFRAAVSAHFQSECLAAMSGLFIRWNELELEITDAGDFRYGRTDLLNYLLTAARENAWAAIAECRLREIPCIIPIDRFEAAEVSRDDADVDKIDVLTSYWSASLQAKVLLMLCGQTKNEPIPPQADAVRESGVPTGSPSRAENGVTQPTKSHSALLQPSATGLNPLLRPTGTSYDWSHVGAENHGTSPRFVGVPIRPFRLPGGAVPKSPPKTNGGASQGVGALVLAVGAGVIAGLRKLFRDRSGKTNLPPSTKESEQSDRSV